MVIELVVMLITGIICFILGFLLWKKQKISIMHNYHHRNVKQQDVRAYTRLMGIGVIVIGICTGITGIINYVLETGMGWIIFALGFIAGLIIMNKSQRKYNGSWFS